MSLFGCASDEQYLDELKEGNLIMSEKKNKHKINIPVYDVESQMDFLISVSNLIKFDTRKLITLIFADWICNFQEISSMQGPEKAILSYLESTSKTRNKLNELKEVILNDKKSK